jgi:hypothetical protein
VVAESWTEGRAWGQCRCSGVVGRLGSGGGEHDPKHDRPRTGGERALACTSVLKVRLAEVQTMAASCSVAALQSESSRTRR